jgi:hypothetical protein
LLIVVDCLSLLVIPSIKGGFEGITVLAQLFEGPDTNCVSFVGGLPILATCELEGLFNLGHEKLEEPCADIRLKLAAIDKTALSKVGINLLLRVTMQVKEVADFDITVERFEVLSN